MDHHCPWTSNCVSHTTFPHFIRFLSSATLGLLIIESLLFTRLSYLWTNRDLPAYLGPSLPLLSHLLTTFAANSFTLFLLSILLVRNLYSLAVNTTTIETWELARHETLLRRARAFGGYLDTPDGDRIRIARQEFPYDIGVWRNVCAGMGSRNPLAWVNPLAATPRLADGLRFEVNGFEDKDKVWPPPDPDRAYRRRAGGEGPAFTYRDAQLGAEETVKAFRARQAEDAVRRRKPFVQRLEAVRDRWQEADGYGYGDGYGEGGGEGGSEEDEDGESEEEEKDYGEDGEGEEGWRNSEGERLKDFGVDEDVEFYDEQEDDIPLSELLARRQAAAAAANAGTSTSSGWAASGSTY